MEFKNLVRRFLCRGLDLSIAADDLQEGRFPILKNIRSYVLGKIESRPGLTAIDSNVVASQTPVHSIRRLNDGPGSTWARIVGTGTNVAYGQTSFSSTSPAGTGFSGDPITMVPFRPSQSVRPWMYMADSSKMRKVRADGTLHKIGLPPPTVPPTVSLAQPKYKVINECEVAGDWTEGGDAGTPALVSGQRVDTTVAQILYDSGSTGWACVMPSDISDIGPGTRLQFDTGNDDWQDPLR